MLIAIRSLRIITVQEERLLRWTSIEVCQERRRYFHFLRVTSLRRVSAPWFYVPCSRVLVFSCSSRVRGIAKRSEPDFYVAFIRPISSFTLSSSHHRRGKSRVNQRRMNRHQCVINACHQTRNSDIAVDRTLCILPNYEAYYSLFVIR